MIRIRHPQGASTFPVDDATTWAQLETFLSGLVSTKDYELRSGYPPRPIDTSAVTPSTRLSEPPLSIKRGDQIILAAKAANGSAAPSVAPSAAGSAQTAASTVPSFGRPAPNASAAPPRSGASGGGGGGGAPLSRSAQVAMRAYAESSAAAASSAPQPSAANAASKSAATSAGKKAAVEDGEVYVRLPTTGEHLTLKVVPDDNSCLFHAIAVLFHQKTGSDVCKQLRKVVADAILANPIDYSDAVLGMPREEYARKINDEKTWGGAIELSVLSSHFSTELVSLDVSTGVAYRFGESADPPHSQKGFLVHSGIHYDSLVLLPAEYEPPRSGGGGGTGEVPLDFARTLFPVEEGGGGEGAAIESAAKELVGTLRARHYHTDTATFDLRCGTCGEALVGEKGASRHAMQTGHTDFREA